MPIITAQAPLPPTTPSVGPQARPLMRPEQSNTVKQQGTPESLAEATTALATEKAIDPLSNKFAILARKEKSITTKMMELRSREEALKAREAEYQNSYIPKSRLSEDPLGVLEESGVDYNKLTEFVLNRPNQGNPEILALQKKIQILEEAQNKTTAGIEQNQTQAYTQAVNQIRSEVTALVSSNEAYETIQGTESSESVVKLIEDTFKETGKLMSIEEAAEEVEAYLVDHYLKVANLKKIRSKLTPLEEAMKQAEIPSKQQARPIPPSQPAVNLENPPPTRTLTQSMDQTPSRRMSDKDRRERAIAAFMGQLK